MKPAILLVDDERKTLKNFARYYGSEYTVYLAESAQEATEELYRRRSEIGVVICDERMPLIRGVDFLARLAREQPQVVQILTTAYTDVNVLQEAVNLPIHRYVPKPWDYEVLTEAIESGAQLHRERMRQSPIRNPFTILRDIAKQSEDATQILDLLIDTELTPLQIHYVSLITLIAAHIQTTSGEIADFFDKFGDIAEFGDYRIAIVSDEVEKAEQIAGRLDALGLATSVAQPGVSAPVAGCTLLALDCSRYELTESALSRIVRDIHEDKLVRPDYIVAYCDSVDNAQREQLESIGADSVANRPLTALNVVHYLARLARIKHAMNNRMV
jgi:two-component system probable response regulator PhcQ